MIFFMLDLFSPYRSSINLLRSSRLLPTIIPALPKETTLSKPDWIAHCQPFKIPTIDRIVLVPDQATFLAAIEHWSLKGLYSD